MIFYFEAYDHNGKSVSDYVDAATIESAKQKIRQKGLYTVKIAAHDMAPGEAVKGKTSGVREIANTLIQKLSVRFSFRSVGLFSRQLATLLKAGLPLPVAIADIVEQLDNKHFRNIISDIKEKIEEGSSFSTALSRHRNVFSDMYVHMVRAGENLGSLDLVIDRLAEIEQKTNTLRSKIRSALWYPSFMMIFAVCVLMFLMINVVPVISEMFVEQKKTLPLPTIIIIGISNFLSKFWFMIPVMILLSVYLYRRYRGTEQGRKKIDEIKLKMPFAKNLYRKLITLRFTQNLGILLSNRVDLIKSFEIVEKIVGNVLIKEKISEASKMIREGSSVTNALAKTDFLPKMVIGMISAGEAGDKLDKMLMNIGEVYETELDLTVTGLTSLIEPVIIIFMGFIIGTIVLSVMLPIMEMNLLVQ